MSALISRNAILLALNEAEANALLDALVSYEGPWKGEQKLTDAERAWGEQQIKRAHDIAGLLHDELMARHHEREAAHAD